MRKLKLFFACLLMAVLSIGQVWAADVTGTINFNSTNNGTPINAASVTGDDSQGNTWTITTAGTTSFTANAEYYQVGSSNKPATSITFTTTLAASQTIKAFSAKFGGFSGTAGTVTLKVGETTVGTGSLNATTDVTVPATTTTESGTTLTVTVTGISKGVKAYYISYTYATGSTSEPTVSADPVELESTAYDDEEIALTYGNLGEASVTNVNVTLHDDEEGNSNFTGGWISDVQVAADKNSITFDAAAYTGTTEDRVAYMKIVATVGEKSPSTIIAITQAKYKEPTGTFEPFSGDIAEGDYLIVADGAGMNTTVSGSRLQYTALTLTGDNYVNPDAAVIWHIAASATDGYWTIYSEDDGNYAAATGSNNQAQMLASGTDDKSLWGITHSGAVYTITNKSNSRFLKKNGTYGFACYADGTVSLYKKQVEGQPKAPTFSVLGGNYESAQTVEISCETTGATIHYTIDGTTPTSASPTYSTALNISSTTTVKAIAIKNDVSSTVASATYTIIVWQTVADVWDDITTEGPLNAHIYGYVSQTNVSGYANNFYISDNGSTEGNQLYAYRMDMNSFTVAVGDKVKLAGDLTILNEVKEFKYTNAENCGKVIALEAKGALQSVAVSGTPTKTEYAANEDFDPAGLKVMGTYANGFVGEITEGITWGNDLTGGKVTESTTVQVTATVSEVASQAYNVAVTVAAKTLLSIAATPASYTIYTGEALPEPVIMATYSEGDPADVSAEATYDSENVFDTETPGEQEITVSYTFGGATETTTYAVTVVDYANDAAHPYTPEQARYITINAVGSTKATKDIYVQGIVSRANAVTGTNKRQRYWISVDGETTSTEFEVYNGKYLTGGDFSTTNQLVAGDEVIVKGKVIYYQSTTPEFATGESQLESLLRTPQFEIQNVASLAVGDPDMAVSDLNVTKDGEGSITLEANTDDADYVTIVNNKIHAVEQTENAVTITASLAQNGIYKEVTTTFTVNIVAATQKYTITFDGNGADGGSEPEEIAAKAENAPVTISANTWTKTGYTFDHWKVFYIDSESEEHEVSVNDNAFTMPAANVTIQAQWRNGNDFTWDATAQGYENAQDLGVVVNNPVVITFAKGDAQNPPKYYTSNNGSARFYTNGTLTISALEGNLITSVTFNTNINVSPNVGIYENKTWTGLAKDVVFTASASVSLQTITVTYITGTVSELVIPDVVIKTTEDTKQITFTTKTPSEAEVSYQVNDENVATITNGVVTRVATQAATTSVTASIAAGSNYTATSTTFNIIVTEKTIPELSFDEEEYTANLGTTFTAPTLNNPEELTVTYSCVPETGVVTVNPSTGAVTLDAEGQATITATFAGNEDFAENSASYTLNVVDPNKDVITAALLETGNSYSTWFDKTFTTTIKYAGNSMTGTGEKANTIQMRNQSPSGIVTTSAIGYLASISATATKNSEKALEIYAKNTKYESSADLYDSEKCGEKIGTISSSGQMSFEQGKAYDDNYKYIGIKATGGVYYDAITITWTPATFTTYTVTYKAGAGEGTDVTETIDEGESIKLASKPEGFSYNNHGFVGWKLENEEEETREVGSSYTVDADVNFVAQWIPVYTITYKAGDGNGEDVEVNNIPAGDYELAGKPEGFSRENYDFVGWKLNNTGDLLEVGDTYSVSGNAEFTAQWSYVKQNAELSYTTTSYNIIKGQTFAAPTVNNPNSLTVTYSGDNNEIAIVDAETGALTLQGGIGTITVTASSAMTEQYYAGSATYTLTIKDNKLAGNWRRINATEDLQVGMKVIIAQYVSSGNNIYTMGAQGSNNRPAVESSLSENVLIPNASTEIFTLVDAGNGHYALKAKNGKYLYNASSSNNSSLKSKADIESWTITIASGKATINSVENSNRTTMRYNPNTNGNSPLFNCYANGQNDIALYTKTPKVEGTTDEPTQATTLDDYADIVLDGGKVLTIDDDKTFSDVTAGTHDVVDIEDNKTLTVNDMIIGTESTYDENNDNTTSNSTQVKIGNNGSLVVVGDLYLDVQLSNGAFDPNYWYMISAPFNVSVAEGVYTTNGTQVPASKYAVWTFDAELYATCGTAWRRHSGTMQAGRAYLIGFDDDVDLGNPSTIRLKWQKESNTMTVPGTLTTQATTDGGLGHNNWNALGNPTLRHISLTTNAPTHISVFDNANHNFNPEKTSYATGSFGFVVGTPLFIQQGTSEITLEDANGTLRAPARSGSAAEYSFCVKIKKQGVQRSDNRIYVQASEQALPTFEMGKDLASLNSSSNCSALLWTNAYGQRLAAQDAPLVNNQAIYDLGLYAPAAGTYSLSAEAIEGADLYVTYEGAIVWNLSLGDYEMDLVRGTTTGYGLLLVVQPNQMPTGVENGELLNGENGVQKILLNGQLYILRDGHLYDAVGKEMK